MSERVASLLDYGLDTAKCQEERPGIGRGKWFVKGWEEILGLAIDSADAAGWIDNQGAQGLRDSLKKWTESDTYADPDHGAWHSYFVYEGMRYIARGDERESEVDDKAMQVLAVMHDFGQFLKMRDPVAGGEIAGDARRKHGKLMSVAVRYFGREMGMDKEQVRELALALRHHDAVFDGKDNVGGLGSYLAELLSDADKLCGGGIYYEPDILLLQALQRNNKGHGNRNGTGWYLLRPDLETEDRETFEYGSRWNLDAVSAMRRELVTMKMFTQTGQGMMEGRFEALKNRFEEHMKGYYQLLPVQIERIVRGIEREGDSGVELGIVGKDQEQSTRRVRSLDELRGLVEELFDKPLKLDPKYNIPGYQQRGWMIMPGQTDEPIDPSVARFVWDEEGKYDPEGGLKRFLKAMKVALFEEVK